MKILIYGAGVLGSVYAAYLQRAGHAVTLLARGQRYTDLQENGLTLEDEVTGRITISDINLINHLAPEDLYDWIMVVMRKNQVAEILPVLAANKTPNVLFMVNNAAGPDEYIKALGRDRVVLGFVGAGGAREGYLVRYALISSQPGPLGELDGQVTPRLEQLAQALQAAGFAVTLCPNIDAWLKTHVALVSPVANAIYLAGGDNFRLARTRDGLVLMVRAIREGLRVLSALDIPITPPQLNMIHWVPEPILVAVLRRMLNTERAKLVMARHANAARDEMQQLAAEFKALATQSGVPTPALDELATYLDPKTTPLPEGSTGIPLHWRNFLIAVSAIASAMVALIFALRRSSTTRPSNRSQCCQNKDCC